MNSLELFADKVDKTFSCGRTPNATIENKPSWKCSFDLLRTIDNIDACDICGLGEDSEKAQIDYWSKIEDKVLVFEDDTNERAKI